MNPASRSLRAGSVLLQSILLGIALLSASLAAALAWRMQAERVLARDSGTLLLTTERRVPGVAGVEVFDGGWSLAEARAVATRLRGSHDVFVVDKRLSSAGPAGARAPLLVIELAPIEGAERAPEFLADCHQGAVSVSPGLFDVRSESRTLRIEDIEHTVYAIAPAWLRWIAGAQVDAYALRCSRKTPDSAEQLLAIRRPDSGPDVSADILEQASPELLVPAGFERRIRAERLYQRARQAIEARFGWIGAAAVGAVLVLLGLCAGVGVMCGLALRRHAPIRRALGASGWDLWWYALRRACLITGTAVAIALPPLLWTAVRFDTLAPNAWVSTALLLLLAGSSALLVATVAIVLGSAWGRTSLSGDTGLGAGAYVTRASMGVWMLGLAGTCALVVTAVRVAEHSRALSSSPLGYDAAGLTTLPLRLPTTAQAGDGMRDQIGRIRAWLSAELERPEGWTLICNSPWHYGSSALHRDYGASVGTFVGIAPGAMAVLGIPGAELDEASWGDSRSLLLQTRQDAVRESMRHGWRVQGEVDGVLLGSNPGLLRTILFVPLPAMPACQDLELVFRTQLFESGAIQASRQRLSVAFPDVALGEALAVSDVIARYRAPVTTLSRFLLVVCAAALAGQVALVLALTLLWTEAQSRSMAIRRALGATSTSLLQAQCIRMLPAGVVAGAGAMPLAFVFQTAVAGALVDFVPFDLEHLLVWTFAVSTTAVVGTLAVSVVRLRRRLWVRDLAA